MPCKAWEIWLVNVKYEDTDESKRRPVLAVPDGCGAFRLLKMTKTAPRDKHEHRIIYWKESGLFAETTIRTGKQIKPLTSDFVHKLGDLHPVDVVSLQNKLIEFLHNTT